MRLKLVFLTLVALLLGYSGYWFVVASNADVFLEKFQLNLDEKEIEFSYDDYSVSGFPYRLVFDFTNPVFKYKNGPLVSEMTGGNLQAIAQPWKLDHFILFVEESNTKIIYEGQKPTEFLLEPALMNLSFSEGENNGYRLSIEMANVKMLTTLDMSLPEHYESISLHLRKNRISNGTEDTLLEPILLDLVLIMAVNQEKSFNVETTFRGLDVPKLSRTSLEAWRDQGGTVEIENVSFNDTDSKVTANGSFTLDNLIRPLGTIGIEADNAKDIIVLLEAGRFIAPGEALLLQISIDSLRLSVDTTLPVSVAFTVQDGVVALGPLPLFEVGPVVNE